MNDSEKSRLRGGTKGDAARRERLASELRANLKKRKAQARMRKAGSAADASTSADAEEDMPSHE